MTSEAWKAFDVFLHTRVLYHFFVLIMMILSRTPQVCFNLQRDGMTRS